MYVQTARYFVLFPHEISSRKLKRRLAVVSAHFFMTSSQLAVNHNANQKLSNHFSRFWIILVVSTMFGTWLQCRWSHNIVVSRNKMTLVSTAQASEEMGNSSPPEHFFQHAQAREVLRTCAAGRQEFTLEDHQSAPTSHQTACTQEDMDPCPVSNEVSQLVTWG